MSKITLSAYRIMWIFVFFDLPVTTKKQRKDAAQFRKKLEGNGFTMLQFSVYTRFCGSREATEVQAKRVIAMLPEEGHVFMLFVTDKQYSGSYNYYKEPTKGKKEPRRKNTKRPPLQLEIF